MKSENRLKAEAIMRTPQYWRDRDPDLMEQVHRMMEQEVGTGVVARKPPPTMGGKGHPL
jgi:hypothetical protein